MKAARTVWGGGKSGDNFKGLPIVKSVYPATLLRGWRTSQLFLGCTDPLTAEYVSDRTGLASVAVSSRSKQLGTWRISNYTPEYRETSGVGKRPVLTPDEVLRLPLDKALVMMRGQKVLQVDKFDYSQHPEASRLRACKASAHIPAWKEAGPEEQNRPEKAAPRQPRASPKKKRTAAPAPNEGIPKKAGIVPVDRDSIFASLDKGSHAGTPNPAARWRR